MVPEVFRVYGNVCHLCNQPIDMNLKSPAPMSKSVDRILGSHTGFDMRYLRPAPYPSAPRMLG